MLKLMKVNRQAWVEQAGARVLLLRLPGVDITFTWWNQRINVFVFLHDGQSLETPAKVEVGPYDIIVQRADA